MDTKDYKKISSLEKDNISEKPWHLRGEVHAKARPVNSLLNEELTFDKDVKAPKITPEKTEELEAIIRQRIKDAQYDDPVKKQKPSETVVAKQVEVSGEKSKLGLADVYEQQFLSNPAEKAVKEGSVKEVEKRLKSLLKKLDALYDR